MKNDTGGVSDTTATKLLQDYLSVHLEKNNSHLITQLLTVHSNRQHMLHLHMLLLPGLQLLVLLPYLAQLQLQTCSVLGNLVQGGAGISQLRLVGRLHSRQVAGNQGL